MEHLRLAPRHRVEPTALGIARHDITLYIVPLIVGAPEVLPVGRLFEITIVDVHPSQALSHLGDAIVIVGIFDGSRASTIDAVGDIAQFCIFFQAPSSMFLVICSWVHLSILQHRLKRIVIIDAFQSFHKGISNHHFRIGTTLRPTITIATPGIRHIALPFVDIQQRINDVHLSFGINQRDEGRRRAIGIPDGIVVIVIRRLQPFGVLAVLIHRHQHCMVKGCIEHPLVPIAAFDLHTTQQLFPTLANLY